MLQIILALNLLLSPSVTSFGEKEAVTGTLSIKVDNVKKLSGRIWVGIYDSENNFLVKEKAIVEGFPVTQKGELTLEIPDLKYGDYAIALFHDVNDNGVMDRNFVGIPSEPYAFSKKPRSRFRLPKFDEVKFTFQQTNQILITRLKSWF